MLSRDPNKFYDIDSTYSNLMVRLLIIYVEVVAVAFKTGEIILNY